MKHVLKYIFLLLISSKLLVCWANLDLYLQLSVSRSGNIDSKNVISWFRLWIWNIQGLETFCIFKESLSAYQNMYAKELSFSHKHWFSIPCILATQCRRPLIFQTINYVRPKNLSFKYQRSTPSDCKDICIRKFELVEFLWTV